MPPSFRIIPFASPEYTDACRLRDTVLRHPLGMSLAAEDLTPEADQLHFGLFAPNHSILACVIAVPSADHTAKLRQMAVAPDHAGQGLGTTLLEQVEAHLSNLGVLTYKLHARETAIPFYQKCGYTPHGPRFIEVGIPHVLMDKQIA